MECNDDEMRVLRFGGADVSSSPHPFSDLLDREPPRAPSSPPNGSTPEERAAAVAALQRLLHAPFINQSREEEIWTVIRCLSFDADNLDALRRSGASRECDLIMNIRERAVDKHKQAVL